MAREGMAPKAAKYEANLARAVKLAAGLEPAGTSLEAHPIGAMIEKFLTNGGKLKIEPLPDTSALRLEDDTSKLRMGAMTYQEQHCIDAAFVLLEDSADELRIEALRMHLDVLLTMLGWRRDGIRELDDAAAEAFRDAQAIARKGDILSALAVSGLALIQAQIDGKVDGRAVDSFFTDTAKAFPIEGTATTDEVRGLYGALESSLDGAIDELVRVATDRIPSPHKERLSKGLEDLFTPYRAMAQEAGPTASSSPSAGANIGDALLAYGSALFPGLGVAIKGFEAAGALLDGHPGKAIEAAATMIPAGETTLAIVKQSAKALGVKLPLGL